MSVLLARVGLVAAGVAAVLTGLLGMREPAAPTITALAAPQARGRLGMSPFSAESLASVVRHDPFRVQRSPSPVSYDPLRPTAGPEPVAPPAPKPVLTLSGIVWGEEPAAVIEGLPGLERARVLHRGDQVAGVTLRTITPDQVILVGMDTSWALRVRQPW